MGYNIFYYDQALPMGCSTSCSIFEQFSTALEWIAKSQLQASAVLHILDDFFIYRCNARALSSRLIELFGSLSIFGCPYRVGKTMGPYTTLQFAGITLDSLNMEARLPVDKLQKCRNLLSEFNSTAISNRSLKLCLFCNFCNLVFRWRSSKL